MRLLSVWLVVLGLATTLALGLALLAPRPVSESLERELGERLHGASQSASLLLRLSARQWIDTAQRDATDAVLLEAVSEANRGPADLGILHKTVQERLRAFATKAGAELALATDGHGKVLARVGVDEATYKDAVDGLPLVAAALRGVRSDDTLVTDGHLYRLVAAPMVAAGGSKFIGVLVLGQEIGSALAQSLHERLDVQTAFFLRGRVVGGATGWPAALAEDLGVEAASQRTQLQAGATPPLHVGKYLVVLAPVTGQVADALLAVAVARPDEASLPALVAGVVKSDPRQWPVTSLGIVGAGLLLVLLINGVLLAVSFGRPLRQLAASVEGVARGDASRVVARSDAWGPLTRAINHALEHAEITRADAPEPVRPPPAFTPPPPRRSEPVSPPPRRPPTAPVVERVVPTSEASPSPSLFDDPMTSRGRRSPTSKRPVIADDDDEIGGSSMPRLEQTGERFAPGAPELLPVDPPSGGLALLEPLVPSSRSSLLGDDDESTTIAPQSPLVAAITPTADPLEAEMQEVFAEFVDTKRNLGESVDGLTYDKFAAKLRSNREQLMSKHNCKTVRFAVYIKDGKAALKAVPVT